MTQTDFIARAKRELSNAARAAVSDPQFIATLSDIKSTMAEVARLQRDTNQRIKAKAEARSPKQPRKQGVSKASTGKPTFQPTQKNNTISQFGHQGAGRESLSTAQSKPIKDKNAA